MASRLGQAASQKLGGRKSDWVFVATGAILFFASAAGTVYLSASQSASMSMPDGMSSDRGMPTPWMGTPGQTWLAAAAWFMVLWVVMMAAMMLPSLIPELWTYRRYLAVPNDLRVGALTALAGAGYFFAWAVFGVAAYGLGAALSAAATQSTAPAALLAAATGSVVVLAGVFQLTRWKIHHLECCRQTPSVANLPLANASGAWQYGLRLGAHCVLCCLGLIVLLLATGMMNLGTMIIVAAAITVERLAPRPAFIARALGVGLLAAGVVLIARAAGVV